MPFLFISKNKCRRRLFLYFTLVAVFADYSPQTYPNGMNSPKECGTLAPSLLCDPLKQLSDGNVNANHAELIQKLDQIRADSKCLCEDTDIGSCVDGNGTMISLAIVPRMQRNDSIRHDGDGRRRAVLEFAEDLRKRQSRGQCDDDVLIVYSLDDNELWVSTGAVSGRVITSKAINETEVIAGNMLNNKKPTQAFLYMLDHYHQLLDRRAVHVSAEESGYLGAPLLMEICLFVLGLITIAIAICIGFLCAEYCCGKDNQDDNETSGIQMQHQSSAPDSFHVIGRMGKPGNRPRPILCRMKAGVRLPLFKELADRLKKTPGLSHINVRRAETPNQRHEGYLRRQAAREQQPLTPYVPEIKEPTSPIEKTREEPQ